MSELIIEKIVSSVEETAEIAVKLAEEVKCGDVIALIGNLGAGKTFFTKAFCSRYDIDEVVSPSFSIVNEYYGDKKVFHFDFYRLKNIDELQDIGFYDYLNDDYAVTLIEWANLFMEILPKRRYEVNIEILEDNKRKITIYKK